jgi:AraC family transcriptional regulator of adaptative response/methylated-DNA-[protein]-cysteine methyltransferase
MAARQSRVLFETTGSREVRLHVRGTNFQIQVWRALLSVPFGHTSSYGKIAGKIGRPGAARAVGRAVGDNPVAFLIPCHRVLRGDGGLGGYRWRPDRKAAMLAWEAAVPAA